MIHIRQVPETSNYIPHPTVTIWVKTIQAGALVYRLEAIDEVSIITINAGCRNRELAPSEQLAYAKLSLLESGAVLASFPFLSKLPGAVQTDLYSVWFVLDAPVLIPAAIFGKTIEIDAGKHLMASSLGSWVVFFRPQGKEHRLK